MPRIRIDRVPLYEQVWSSPIKKVATSYGVTSAAVVKACQTLGVPRPPSGYWIRLEHGKASPRPELPPLASGEEDHVWLDVAETKPVTVSVSDEISSVPAGAPEHPLVKVTRRELRGAAPYERGMLITRRRKCLAIRVSPASLDRALAFLDSLFKTLEADGASVELRESRERSGQAPDHWNTIVKIDGSAIALTLSERSYQKPHVPTAEENRDERRSGYRSWPRHDYVPTGELTLTAEDTEWLYVKRTWSDRRRHRLDGAVGSVVMGLRACSEAMKAKRQQREQERLQQQVAAENAAREHKLQEYRQQLGDDLEKMASAWTRANNIRGFVDAAAKVLAEEQPGAEVAAWISWAREFADGIDPLCRPGMVPKLLSPRAG